MLLVVKLLRGLCRVRGGAQLPGGDVGDPGPRRRAGVSSGHTAASDSSPAKPDSADLNIDVKYLPGIWSDNEKEQETKTSGEWAVFQSVGLNGLNFACWRKHPYFGSRSQLSMWFKPIQLQNKSKSLCSCGYLVTILMMLCPCSLSLQGHGRALTGAGHKDVFCGSRCVFSSAQGGAAAALVIGLSEELRIR